MKVSILFLLACMALLAVGARADTPEEPQTLVKKMKQYAEKATDMVKTAFNSVQESEAVQQARRWLAERTDQAEEQLAWLKEQLAKFWKRTPPA
ncbi:APOC3 protein, partial [Galbula dea]|nr:APOC3 protein [Galbula dea]